MLLSGSNPDCQGILATQGHGCQRPRLASVGVIGELYPQAYEHLCAARHAKSEMAARWSDLLDGGLVDESVVTNDDGTGRITAFADWPDGSRKPSLCCSRSV